MHHAMWIGVPGLRWSQLLGAHGYLPGTMAEIKSMVTHGDMLTKVHDGQRSVVPACLGVPPGS